MLLKFSVTNHGPFRDKAELFFVATKRKDEPNYRIPWRGHKHGVNPVVGLWGGNASGKSSLLETLRDLGTLVRGGLWAEIPNGDDPGKSYMRLTPFVGQESQPTTFEVDFTVGDSQVYYLVSFLNGRVLQEVLEEQRPKSRVRSLIDRERGLFRGVHKDVLEEALAIGRPLLNAGHRAGGRLAEIQDSFLSHIQWRGDVDEYGCLAYLESPMDEEVTAVCGKDFAASQASQRHFSAGQEEFKYHAKAAIAALRTGSLLVVDDLGTNMHPVLLEDFVQWFTDPDTNPHGAQLLFSTHCQNLMDSMRSDQIALLDKTKEGASALHYASDYKWSRKDPSWSRLYAGARIGGIPMDRFWAQRQELQTIVNTKSADTSEPT